MAILSVMFAMGLFYWQSRMNQNALRYGTFQVASDIRQAQELAKSQRYQYTLTFSSGATSYTITCAAPCSYNQTVQLPAGVTTNGVIVIWSAFGQPDAAHTISVTNSIGTGTVSVNATGGLNYQLP